MAAMLSCRAWRSGHQHAGFVRVKQHELHNTRRAYGVCFAPFLSLLVCNRDLPAPARMSQAGLGPTKLIQYNVTASKADHQAASKHVCTNQSTLQACALQVEVAGQVHTLPDSTVATSPVLKVLEVTISARDIAGSVPAIASLSVSSTAFSTWLQGPDGAPHLSWEALHAVLQVRNSVHPQTYAELDQICMSNSHTGR